MAIGNISAQYQLDWDIAQASQNVSANTSQVYGRLIVRKTGGSGYWSNNANGWSINIDGQTASGTYTYDFRKYSELTLWSGYVTITHNADGTRSVGSSGYASMSAPSGSLTLGANINLTTIPRASTASFSSSPVTGNAVTISTNRASGSFTHDITYGFGAFSGTIATGVTDSVSWTPPHSLFNQSSVLNTTAGSGSITVVTKNGGTVIGTTSTGFTLTLNGNQIPTLTGATFSEAVTSPVNIASAIGAYVQNQSKLNYSISGATGIQGSSISAYSFSVGAVSASGASGTTDYLQNSGTVTITAKVTDSRGRVSNPWTTTISVLAWSPPQITSFTVDRALSSGVLDPNGTYLKVTVTGTVSNLTVSGSQKNTLAYLTDTSPADANTWTNKRNTDAGATTSVSTNYTFGTYAENASWDVRMILRDRFATNDASYQAVTVRSVSVARVALDLGLDNAGIGKFWEKGTLDVGGDIYSSGVLISTPIGSVTMFGGATAPSGWLLCQGQAVSRTTYADLFAVIGTAFGAGNGSSTFNVPNFKGRVPVGVDSGQTEFDTLGETGGAKTHTLTTTQVPTQRGSRISWGAGGNVHFDNVQAYAGPSSGNGIYTVQNDLEWGESAGGGAHNNLQPYMAINFIIKVN